jgi:hypothetical protein
MRDTRLPFPHSLLQSLGLTSSLRLHLLHSDSTLKVRTNSYNNHELHGIQVNYILQNLSYSDTHVSNTIIQLQIYTIGDIGSQYFRSIKFIISLHFNSQFPYAHPSPIIASPRVSSVQLT